jgi:RNA polymerase sigma factor (sigma-70 family)
MMAIRQLERVVERLRQAALPGSVGGRSDGQLLECFIAHRDEDAFAAIVHRHGPMVLAVCRRLLHQQHDAEDAFQATFLVLVRKASSVVPREMLANWLYGVACRTALKARTATAKRWAREQPMNRNAEPEVVATDTQSELRPLLDKELSLLPDIYRTCIVCCDLEGKTRQEAARQLGWSEGTVSGRLSRARAILAKRLARRGLMLSAGSLVTALSQTTASAAVPAELLVSTIRAGSLLARGELVMGATSVKVAALTEGVLKAMWFTKVAKVSAIVALVSVFGLGGTGLAYRAQGTAQASGATATAPARLAAEPKKEPAKAPPLTEKERLEILARELAERIRTAQAAQQPEQDLERARKQLEETLRRLQLEEAEQLEAKKREQVRIAATTIQREIEKALEAARKADDRKTQLEILEEIEKVVKEMKRKAGGKEEGKKGAGVPLKR